MNPSVASPESPRYTRGYKRWVLWVLLIVYILNFVDRTILNTLGQAIKQDLLLTDLQLGLLTGLTFALLYTVMGIPIARIAERRSRVMIISLSVAVWSLMTALCGVAANYVQLLLCRVGVGIGEAGCTPPAQSLISDYFPAEQRASALSIYSLGIPLGGLIGAVAGGWIAEEFHWRTAFLVIGLPGVAIAVLTALTVKEPPRGHSEVGGKPFSGPIPTLSDVIRKLWRKPTFLHLCAGITLVSFVGYGNGGFTHPYFVRRFQLGYAEAAIIFGLIGGLSAAVGTLVGGFVTDRLARRDKRWYVWTPAIGLSLAAVISLIAFTRDDWITTAVLLTLPGIFSYTYLAPTFALTHNMVEPRMRATATAVLFFVLNLIALGFGPVFVGFLSDLFTSQAFTSGDFVALCPGGVAPANAAEGLATACREASAAGLQNAILSTLLILFWGALHYLLAAQTLERDLEN